VLIFCFSSASLLVNFNDDVSLTAKVVWTKSMLKVINEVLS